MFPSIKAQETASNRKQAKSVLRMVFKSLETFLNRFNFPTLMRSKVKLLEILLRPSHTNFWLSNRLSSSYVLTA